MRADRFLFLGLLVASTALADGPPRIPEGAALPPSIHALQDAEHRDDRPGPEPVLPPSDASRSVRPLPTRDVFGCLPYWEYSSLGDLQWDLLTHVAYFSVGVTPTGSVTMGNSVGGGDLGR